MVRKVVKFTRNQSMCNLEYVQDFTDRTAFSVGVMLDDGKWEENMVKLEKMKKLGF